MTTRFTEEDNVRLKGIAVRLRELQAEAAAQPERRRELLRNEITRSLSDVPGEQRKRYLEVLLAQFAIEDHSPHPPAAATTPTEQTAPAPSPQSAEECLETFLSMADGISDERRVSLGKKLAEAGFNWVDRDQLLLEVADDFRTALGLPPGQQPRLTRMVQLSVVLVDLLNRLDHMALKTFAELAPRSTLGVRPQEFRDAVAGFLTGSTDSVEPQIRAISALLGGLLAATLGGGREFGRQYLERFSPSSIEDVVKGEGKVKLFGNEKALCWDKYKDLARDYATPDLVERRIRECLGSFAEKKASAAR